MVPDLPAIVRALAGAARLARFDPDGLMYFDDDARAVVQSFFAAVLVAPGYAILVVQHLGRVDVTAGPLSAGLVEFFGYVISWTAFPVAVLELSRLMERGERWFGFVVALNWSKVLQMALYLPAALLAGAAAGESGPGAASLLTFLALMAILAYQWFVTRSALNITGVQAAGLTGIDVVLGLMITGLTDGAISG
ncbi:hypothetical protein SAMN05216241_10988 [Limimonas halophila]|uniref:Yip1 domain-containing protein n=1 Tax=Limimonas halophila TaxID=1082479 RepID=A0A1G7THD7_9PROT|nr:hypothetical protein [Limimonas halophila]SDG34738.1 hypothetical protein SAMN05216241_10988 [Limimonas halophila]